MFSSSIYRRATRFLKKEKPSDKEIFYTVYQQLSGKMYSLCIRYTGNAADAREVFIEGMSVLFSESKSSAHYPLIEKKARHIFVQRNIDYLLAKEKDLFKNLPLLKNHEKTVLENLDKYTEAALVHQITQLSTQHRIVFNLHLVENYSIESIGKLLDIHAITVTPLIENAKLAFMKNSLYPV